jgi:hypothetical protein
MKFKVLGQPDTYYTIPPAPTPPPSAWLDVTYQDGNGDDYWIPTNGTQWDGSMWSRNGGGSQMRLRTNQIEGSFIPFWVGLRPTKMRITTAADGDNGTFLNLWNVDGFLLIDHVSQQPSTTVIYDLDFSTSDYDIDRLFYDQTIAKIEIML